MNPTIKGTAYVFGNNIDTDQIYPGRYLELTDPKKIAEHVMEGADPSFHSRFHPGGILIAGKNFGCGSSREHAAIAIQTAGVSVVIAESFARIFYRNCINLGLPLLICTGITSSVREGDLVEINLISGLIKNLTQGKDLRGEPLSEDVLQILEAGGIKPLLKSGRGLK